MQAREFLIRLHLCSQIGLVNEQRLFTYFQQTQQIPDLLTLMQLTNFNQAKAAYFLQEFNSRQLYEQCCLNQRQAQILTILDDEYPVQLKQIYQPPLVLFAKGDLALLKTPQLAVVGARKMSSYAKKVLTGLIPPLCQQLTIVSGLASGVDGLAHQLALKYHGQTIAVIGNGLDYFYPKENTELQKQIMQQGLILTEYALGQKPLRFHFPYRNRIIAGLCHSLLVVEAKHQSGSLITANLALQENRNVLAIPGALDHELSQGCNELIQAGAKLIIKPSDILEEFSNYLTKLHKIE